MPTTLTKPTTQELAHNHFVYSEAMHHHDRQLHRGDIAEGIKAFRELTGQEPKLITLHPTNEPLADAIPEGVAISYYGGCLKWQVWLAVGEIKPIENDDNGRHSLYQNSPILPIPPNDAPPILVQVIPKEETPPRPKKRAVPLKATNKAKVACTKNPVPSNDTPQPLTPPPVGQEAPQVMTERTTRGRHPKLFPEDTIRQLREKGMKIRAIRVDLDHQGIKISLMSISRILKGQRVLLIGGG